MAGLKVVPIKTLADGSLDIADLRVKAEKHKDNLAAFMVQNPLLSSAPNQTHSCLSLVIFRSRTHQHTVSLKTAFKKLARSYMNMVDKFIWTVRI